MLLCTAGPDAGEWGAIHCRPRGIAVKRFILLALFLSFSVVARSDRGRRQTQRRLHPGRRSRLGRSRRLRTGKDPDAEHRPAREGGDAVHAALQRRAGVRSVALRADDGQAPGACRGPRQLAGEGAVPRVHGRADPALAGGRDLADAVPEGRLRDGRDGQVGAGSRRQHRRAEQKRVRPVLRLQLPGRRSQLLPALPVAELREGRHQRSADLRAPEEARRRSASSRTTRGSSTRRS